VCLSIIVIVVVVVVVVIVIVVVVIVIVVVEKVWKGFNSSNCGKKGGSETSK